MDDRDIDISKSKAFLDCSIFDDREQTRANISKGDIALYTLKEPMNDVAVKRIATIEDVKGAASVRAVGVGKTETGVVGVKFLVDIIIASATCENTYPDGMSDAKRYGCRPGAELVAAGLDRDTAPGDSGGSVFVMGADANQYLAASTSRAVDPNGKPGPGGVYVLIGTPEMKTWLTGLGVPASSFAE